MQPTTLAVHAGPDRPGHAPPIELSTTWRFDDPALAAASVDAQAHGGPPVGTPVYGRLHNPTVAGFERALAALEGAPEAVAFASGMAALTACLLAARERGDHVVALRPLYGGSDHLLGSGLCGLGLRVATADTLAEAVDGDTALVLLETPANPTLALADIEAAVAAARGVPLVVDSTFATPVLQNPLRHGATMALHSATKFIGGHGDALGGVVACDAAWAAALRRVRVATGGCLHPLAGYMLHRGLATLPLRVHAAQDNARVLARRLAAHPAVARVRYPELPGGDPLGLLGRQLRGGGAVLSFELDDRHPGPDAWLRALRLVSPAVSLGAVDTLAQIPAALTHRVVPPEDRAASGLSDSLIRLSVGIEDVEDLWADLRRGLEAAERHAAG
ncbi:MAG: PLP-dependent transferase [Alphaproteobacteria bacterium]|nr:PLP-dependent transferase [Alphaproteobacteria bacterium]